jgi:predicted nucleic acid-binding protein
MPVYFIDSSALVKRYRNEPGSNRVSILMKAADQLLIARLTIVEVSSALVRRARMSNSSKEELNAALAIFDAQISESIDIVDLDTELMQDAVRISRKYGLRGADAIQLACALAGRREIDSVDDFVLVGSDLELNAAAVPKVFLYSIQRNDALS